MKKLVLVIIPALICGVMFTSCSDKKEVTNEINVTLKNTENYSKTFVLGDEEGAAIKVQAEHFEKSELIRDKNTNMNVEYHFKPITDFVGKDYVVIEVFYNKTGIGPTEIETVRINFSITK